MVHRAADGAARTTSSRRPPTGSASASAIGPDPLAEADGALAVTVILSK